MGILIQEMVASRSAGVCFTVNPVTGNRDEVLYSLCNFLFLFDRFLFSFIILKIPQKVSISANYGLCKSVVDGSVTPDEFTLTRVMSNGNDSEPFEGALKFEIKSAILGSKGIFDSIAKEGGTVCSEIDPGLRERFCVTDTELKRVANLACFLEWITGGVTLDMEWTFDQDGNLYVLQTRPVTSLNDPSGTLHSARPFTSISDFLCCDPKDDTSWDALWTSLTQNDPSFAKWVTECDTPSVNPPQWNTTYNIGEMLPGSVTPLTLSTFGRALDYGLQELYRIGGGRAWPSLMRHGDRMVNCRVGFSLKRVSSLTLTLFYTFMRARTHSLI